MPPIVVPPFDHNSVDRPNFELCNSVDRPSQATREKDSCFSRRLRSGRLPDAEENAVLLVLGGACFDVFVIDWHARLAALQPRGKALLHFPADRCVIAAGAEVD